MVVTLLLSMSLNRDGIDFPESLLSRAVEPIVQFVGQALFVD
jgi:hypothetical protein